MKSGHTQFRGKKAFGFNITEEKKITWGGKTPNISNLNEKFGGSWELNS